MRRWDYLCGCWVDHGPIARPIDRVVRAFAPAAVPDGITSGITTEHLPDRVAGQQRQCDCRLCCGEAEEQRKKQPSARGTERRQGSPYRTTYQVRFKFGKQAYCVIEVRIGEDAAEVAKKLRELAEQVEARAR